MSMAFTRPSMSKQSSQLPFPTIRCIIYAMYRFRQRSLAYNEMQRRVCCVEESDLFVFVLSLSVDISCSWSSFASAVDQGCEGSRYRFGRTWIEAFIWLWVGFFESFLAFTMVSSDLEPDTSRTEPILPSFTPFASVNA